MDRDKLKGEIIEILLKKYEHPILFKSDAEKDANLILSLLNRELTIECPDCGGKGKEEYDISPDGTTIFERPCPNPLCHEGRVNKVEMLREALKKMTPAPCLGVPKEEMQDEYIRRSNLAKAALDAAGE